MSLRSRARALQRSTGMPFQKALERVRSLGSAPAELARKTGWSLKACDAYLLDPRTRPRFTARGDAPDADAPRVDGPDVDAPDVDARAPSRPLTAICEELREASGALAVCIVDAKGQWLAMSGYAAVMLFALPPAFRKSREPEAFALDPTGKIHVSSFALDLGARLFVLFESPSPLGIVRLRARAAVRAINAILGGDFPAFPLPGGGHSGSGAPAQVSAFDGLFDRLGKLGGGKPS